MSVLAAPLAALIPAAAAHSAAPVTINILGTNDFHGRINANTVKWGFEIEKLRDPVATPGAGNNLLIGAGDLVGASEFASAVQNDQPTIDVMNEIGLDTSSVGNHEFDKGWADLRDRIIGPSGTPNAHWPYLAANVYAKGTTTPVLPEYHVFTEAGVTVGVIGAVTQETSSLVSPGGIQDITIGDAADAINRVAAQLSDGNAANGEAQVIVATVHAGAQLGTETYAQSLAHGGEFAELANVSPQVNAIFEGHTHQLYKYDAPVTGGDTATRPILQTGSYASNIGQVQLTVDPATGIVSSYTAQNNLVPTTGTNDSYITQYPTVLNPINTTVNNALAFAAQVGNTAVGSAKADITTAYSGGSYVNGKYTGGTRDDRGKESTMGDLVANALRDGLPADLGKADIGITNPGGLRAEFPFAGDTVNGGPNNTDGVITYAEANTVLPFINNIWTDKLTGAQLKKIFEEQWSVANPGEIAPSRPFLALGVSDNVRVTLDPSRALGDRVTSVYVNGQPLDPAKTYTVCTFSFLGTGGDYFHTFTQGTTHDTGLVDRDLWISYLQKHPGVSPSFDRQQVQEHGLPQSTVVAGQQVAFTLTNLDLTSQGSPHNTSVDVYLNSSTGTRRVGTYKTTPDNGGTAAVSFKAPANLSGPSTVTAIARPSNTVVGATPGTTAKVQKVHVVYGHNGQAKVTLTSPLGDVPTGTVALTAKGKKVGSATLANGSASIKVSGKLLKPGAYTMRATYSGDSSHAASSDTAKLRVVKATPKVKVSKPAKATAHKTRVKLTIKVKAPMQTVHGKVKVTTGGHVYTAKLVGGKVVVRLKAYAHTGNKKIVVKYLGDGFNHSHKVVKHIHVHH
jgi:5'-nucleotidase